MVFPLTRSPPSGHRGCPADWKDVSFENIRLSDGTAVSGRRINGKTEVWR